jgi:ABC-type transport system involved in multi-copper enzyme maturation permease subunit
VVVIGVMFITAEYRRGLIRTTFTASPRRGRVLAAKAIVLAAVTFAAGLVAVAVTIPLAERLLHENGNPIYPVGMLTGTRIVAGTAALLAVSAVLGLAVGTLLRRSAGAVTAVIAGMVLPYLLATVPGILPVGAAQWLLRVTPAAAFAVQQSATQYPQVTTVYTPGTGYFPLAPWAGFAVLCAWAAAALVLALFLLRRRDA